MLHLVHFHTRWLVSLVWDSVYKVGACLVVLAFLLVTSVFEALSCMLSLVGKSLKRSKDGQCPNPGCVRCLNRVYNEAEILQSLNKFRVDNQVEVHQLSRLYKSLELDEKNLGKSEQCQLPTVLYLSGLTARRFHDISIVDLSSSMLDLKRLRTEYRAVSKRTDLWVKNVTATGSWQLFYLYNQGRKDSTNCSLCPYTAHFVENLQYVLLYSVFGNIMYSVIEPNTHIELHTGPSNVRLRCHIALENDTEAYMVVGGQRVSWVEGQCILFDESYPHEVFHNGKASRAVLLIDFWHPDLTEVEKEAIMYLYG